MMHSVSNNLCQGYVWVCSALKLAVNCECGGGGKVVLVVTEFNGNGNIDGLKGTVALTGIRKVKTRQRAALTEGKLDRYDN